MCKWDQAIWEKSCLYVCECVCRCVLSKHSVCEKCVILLSSSTRFSSIFVNKLHLKQIGCDLWIEMKHVNVIIFYRVHVNERKTDVRASTLMHTFTRSCGHPYILWMEKSEIEANSHWCSHEMHKKRKLKLILFQKQVERTANWNFFVSFISALSERAGAEENSVEHIQRFS